MTHDYPWRDKVSPSETEEGEDQRPGQDGIPVDDPVNIVQTNSALSVLHL